MNVGFFILNFNDSVRSLNLAEKVACDSNIDFVYIFDNNSSKEQVEILKNNTINKKIVLYFSEENLGYNKGTNSGLQKCKDFNPDYVFIANSDVDFDLEVLHKLIESISSHRNIGVLSCIMHEKKEPVLNYYDYPTLGYLCSCLTGFEHLAKKKRKIKTNQIEKNLLQIDFVRNSLVLINYRALEDVSFFDEDLFMYLGESALSKKIKSNNYIEAIRTDCYYDHNHINKKKNLLFTHKVFLKDIKSYCSKYKRLNVVSKLLIYLSYYFGFLLRLLLKK